MRTSTRRTRTRTRRAPNHKKEKPASKNRASIPKGDAAAGEKGVRETTQPAENLHEDSILWTECGVENTTETSTEKCQKNRARPCNWSRTTYLKEEPVVLVVTLASCSPVVICLDFPLLRKSIATRRASEHPGYLLYVSCHCDTRNECSDLTNDREGVHRVLRGVGPSWKSQTERCSRTSTTQRGQAGPTFGHEQEQVLQQMRRESE